MKINTIITKDWLFSLDLLKAISITAVVSFHSTFVPTYVYASVAQSINLLFAPLLFCVPVLFTISFMLLERSLQKSDPGNVYALLKKRFIRIAMPTVFWFTVAGGLILVKESYSSKSISQILIRIIQLALKGKIFAGAYYLLVIFQFLLVFICIHKWFRSLKNVIIAVLIQVICLLFIQTSLQGNLGAQVPDFLRVVERPFFIYWFVYMALGAYLYNRWQTLIIISSQIKIIYKILLLLITSLTMVIEYKWLHSVAGEQVSPFEYAMCSCILSVVIMLLCFSSIEEEKLPQPLKKLVQLLSRYSLGIFCINGILYHVFISFSNFVFKGVIYGLPEILVIKIVGWVFLLAVSLGLSMLLDRLGLRACVR